MEVTLLSSTFENKGIIDVFDSFIWVDRFAEFGDFEIVMRPSASIIEKLTQTSYLAFKESDHTMILESINILTNIVDGNRLIIKGRSLESILDRRIVWGGFSITGAFQTGILTLLNDCFIEPSDTTRDVPNFVFVISDDPVIMALQIDNQFVGDNVYELISTICKSKGVGFKVTLSTTGNFEFLLYAGEDRSYDQSTNPYVVYSPNFDNLLNADYLITDEKLKTAALVIGEAGVGNVRLAVEVASPSGAGSGLSRREMFVDAKDISRNTPAGFLTDVEYSAQLEQKGLEELSKNTIIQAFNGQIDPDQIIYIYKEDFFMGDILQVANEYGHEGKSRVIEVIYSQDQAGENMYPTFSAI